jgi:hypothetical protein
MSEGNAFYGWFEDATQTTPAYEPPRDAPCLFCGFPLRPDDVRTHSFTHAGEYAARSYFYRTHRTCDDVADQPMDSFILDMIELNGD